MKTNVNERMEELKKVLYDMELNSEISKRYNSDELFLLILDEDEDIKKAMQKIINNNPLLLIEYNQSYDLIDWFTDGNYGYTDEYYICEDCHAIFMQPSVDYSYYKEGIVFEGEFDTVCCCTNCLKEYHSEEYIESCKNNPKKLIIMYSKDDIISMGWNIVNDKEYENGMYGINDNPEKILEHYQTSTPNKNKDYIFVRTDENPYMLNYILMAKDKEEE